MKLFIVISFISFINLLGICTADRHIFGTLRKGFDYKLHDTVLIDYKGSEPKSFTILFKYYAAYLLRVGYIEFNITSPSTGNITTFEAKQIHPILPDYNLPTQNFYAKIFINDTVDVKATLRIHKSGIKSNIEPYYGLESLKSVTIVYSKNASNSSSRTTASQSSIGKRQKGDELIHFQSRNVTNTSRFPSKGFEYEGSDYITCVKFRFNSPTAMVLVNTTFIGEKEFVAVVYDMNTEHFVANISVYGMKTQPEKELGVLSLM